MLIIYGIKNCNSMKKAFDALTTRQIPYTFHDYKKAGINTQTLQTWLHTVDSSLILNKKGTTWRKLTEEQQQFALANAEQLIQTLMDYPSLIKRPILQNEQGVFVGLEGLEHLLTILSE